MMVMRLEQDALVVEYATNARTAYGRRTLGLTAFQRITNKKDEKP
jgi:hypothetical protein